MLLGSLTYPSGATNTVLGYFKERYNLELKFKFLQCLDVGSEQRPVYIPIEVCKIVPRQRHEKKLHGSQASVLMKSTFQIQPEPKQSIDQVHDLTVLCAILCLGYEGKHVFCPAMLGRVRVRFPTQGEVVRPSLNEILQAFIDLTITSLVTIWLGHMSFELFGEDGGAAFRCQEESFKGSIGNSGECSGPAYGWSTCF